MDAFYHNLDSNQRESAMGYVLLHLLKTRGKSDETENPLDQMVNMYLTQMLLSLGNFRHLEQIKDIVSTNDIDVARIIDSADVAVKYQVYKANADHLLTLTGLFHGRDNADIAQESVGGIPVHTLMGRGKTYYGFAAAYGKKIHRRATALMNVLERLSTEFELYRRILQDLSSDYFHLIQKVSEKEIQQMMEQVSEAKEAMALKELQDKFLDAYSLWLKSKDPELFKQVESLATTIQRKDPTFRFTPPERG